MNPDWELVTNVFCRLGTPGPAVESPLNGLALLFLSVDFPIAVDSTIPSWAMEPMRSVWSSGTGITAAPVWMAGAILFPLLAAVLGLLGGVRTRQAAGLLGTVATLLAVFGLALTVSAQGAQSLQLGGWSPPLGISLYADGLSVVMLMMSAIVGATSGCFAVAYFSGKQPYFWPLWMLLWTGLHGLFLASDIFNLYVTLELLSLAAVALVALAGGEAILAALRYLLVSLIASMIYLLGVAILYAEFQTLDMRLLARSMTLDWASGVGGGLILLSLLMKAALFPLHFWLPAAHASAPGPVSSLLSALVVKAPFYLIFRFWYGSFALVVTPEVEQFCAWLGMGAILWGSYQAIRQRRLKLLVAYSTVAQLGYLFLAFLLIRGSPEALVLWKGVVLFALSHAFAKGALFLAAGSIQTRCGHDDLTTLSHEGQYLAIPLMTAGLASVALMGLPPSGAFLAKWLLVQESIRAGEWAMAGVIIVGGLLAAIYSFRILEIAFSHPGPREAPDAWSGPTSGTGVAPHPLMLWPPLALALLAVLLGLMAHPIGELLEHGQPFVEPGMNGARFAGQPLREIP